MFIMCLQCVVLLNIHMQYIHGHHCTHNLIDFEHDYDSNAYIQMVYNNMLNPVIAFENMTRKQQNLYHSLELALKGIDQSDTNSLPYMLHKDLWESAKTGEVGPSEDYTISSKTSYVWAITPFSTGQDAAYTQTCEDFGYSLERVLHPWNSLDVHALWEIAKQFNWNAHTRSESLDDILHPDYVYMQWYGKLFSEHYSKSHWHALMGVQRRL